MPAAVPRALAVAAVAAALLAACSPGSKPQGPGQQDPPPRTPTSVAAGYYHGCAIASGVVECWGLNRWGQLGDGSSIVSRDWPVQVSSLAGGAQIVAAGAQNSCAVVGGAAWCWGYNGSGQLGDGTTTPAWRETPVRVSVLGSPVSAITVGSYAHSCAVVSGGAWCWGVNSAGELGNGSGTSSPVPVQVNGLAAGSGVTAISAGRQHTCAIVGGGLRCWGWNSSGQLGDGSTTSSPDPVQVTSLATGVTAVAAGSGFTCAAVGGAAKCWGANGSGQLGDGSTTPSPDPVQVTSLTAGVTALAAGAGHACAIVGGGVRCWGSPYGNTPVPIAGLASGVTSLTAGDYHDCAIADGVAWCWGDDGWGSLGPGGGGAITAVPVRLEGL